MLNLIQSFFKSSRSIHTHSEAQPIAPAFTQNSTKETLLAPHFLSNLYKEAVVTEPIEPQKAGRVKFQGSWWPARSAQEVFLLPGDVVYVVDRKNITLYVELASVGVGECSPAC